MAGAAEGVSLDSKSIRPFARDRAICWEDRSGGCCGAGSYFLRLSIPDGKQRNFAAGLGDMDIKNLGVVLDLKEIETLGVWTR
jgi:hypothetical protein